jgi:hypothetical protein
LGGQKESDISTYHNGEMRIISEDGKDIIKPKVAFDYNTNMRGVDLKDQRLQPYFLDCKKGNKWYIKLKKKLNVAMHNTMELFRATGNQKLAHLSKASQNHTGLQCYGQ